MGSKYINRCAGGGGEPFLCVGRRKPGHCKAVLAMAPTMLFLSESGLTKSDPAHKQDGGSAQVSLFSILNLCTEQCNELLANLLRLVAGIRCIRKFSQPTWCSRTWG